MSAAERHLGCSGLESTEISGPQHDRIGRLAEIKRLCTHYPRETEGADPLIAAVDEAVSVLSRVGQRVAR